MILGKGIHRMLQGLLPAANADRKDSGPPPLPFCSFRSAERWTATGFGLLGCTVLIVAAGLNPYDASGQPLSHGTHRQLGLPPCVLQSVLSLPCPACGMTTSMSLLIHGDALSAWRVNWAGVIIGVLGGSTTLWMLAVAAGVHSGHCTAHKTIQWLVVTSGLTALARYLTL